MKFKVLYKVVLKAKKHVRTGATKHFMNGGLINEMPYFLQIEANPMVNGEVYLIHYNIEGEEVADTLHDGVEDAMEQALWEFKVKRGDWSALAGPSM